MDAIIQQFNNNQSGYHIKTDIIISLGHNFYERENHLKNMFFVI